MQFSIQFPDPNNADKDGLIAVGGELSVEYLIAAYTQGIFPWFNEGDPILWWSPDPRMVLYPKDFKQSKSLKQLVRSNKFEIKTDNNFEKVIKSCSKITRPGQDGTWITNEMVDAYINIYKLGIAHSFETYYQGELVGGLYGLSLGNAFFGESMFHKKTDASKFAFYHLVQFCIKNNFSFIDAQQPTSHLKSLGAIEIPRNIFLKELNDSLGEDTIQGKWRI